MNRAATLKILRVLAEAAVSGAAEGVTVALLCRKTGIRAQEVILVVESLAWAGLLNVHWPALAHLAHYRLTDTGQEVLHQMEEETRSELSPDQGNGAPGADA